ncbi:MAG TPA: hypothetical protein VLC79_10605 [Cellvibrio sp.]|nr:hypothetical protein [Cellvibrio sp.]
MQSLIKTCALPLAILGLTACGGGGGGGDKPTPASSTPASSVAASSTPATSVAPSSQPASSAAASSVAAGNESTQAAVNYTSYKGVNNATFPGYSIAKIDNCGKGISAPTKTFQVFADYDGGVQNQSLGSLEISGWNHATNGSATEWKNLKLAGSNYNFSTSAKMNSSCNDVDTIDMILVKKINDWDHQHSNGFERKIVSLGYKFGDIENIVLDLKVNSASTSIPSIETLKTTYSSYTSASNIEALDEGKVNVDITLHDGKNLNGKIIVQLDQTTLADQWVRVTVPMSEVYFYEEINYVRTPKPLADLSNVVIDRLLVVGETRKGAVLRGDITSWSTSIPETFKEANLSFKKIEFQLKAK